MNLASHLLPSTLAAPFICHPPLPWHDISFKGHHPLIERIHKNKQKMCKYISFLDCNLRTKCSTTFITYMLDIQLFYFFNAAIEDSTTLVPVRKKEEFFFKTGEYGVVYLHEPTWGRIEKITYEIIVIRDGSGSIGQSFCLCSLHWQVWDSKSHIII